MDPISWDKSEWDQYNHFSNLMRKYIDGYEKRSVDADLKSQEKDDQQTRHVIYGSAGGIFILSTQLINDNLSFLAYVNALLGVISSLFALYYAYKSHDSIRIALAKNSADWMDYTSTRIDDLDINKWIENKRNLKSMFKPFPVLDRGSFLRDRLTAVRFLILTGVFALSHLISRMPLV
jgi:hypothetical protein